MVQSRFVWNAAINLLLCEKNVSTWAIWLNESKDTTWWKMVVQAQSFGKFWIVFFRRCRFFFSFFFLSLDSFNQLNTYLGTNGEPSHGTKRLPPLSHLLLFIHLFIVIERCAHHRTNTLYYVCTASRFFSSSSFSSLFIFHLLILPYKCDTQ